MRWFEEQRLKWIGDRIAAKGHINRSDVVEQFGVSLGQAAKDFGTFMREMPEVMTYNKKTKRYEFNYKAFR